MKAIIIGAGRGRRLQHLTREQPKCLVPIGGRPILSWILEALRAGGVDDIVYIGGYLIEEVRRAHPEFRFIENRRWEENNILESLFCAESEMDGPFVTTYADILYLPEAVQKLLHGGAHGDLRLVVDTDWRARYAHRSEHPETDAEKLTLNGDGRVTRIHRDIAPAGAAGEFIGLAYYSARGAERLRAHYRRIREGAAWNGPALAKAYLIHLFQEMVERGEAFSAVPIHGNYIEVDTTQDFAYAEARWGRGGEGRE
jgi:choline kinase